LLTTSRPLVVFPKAWFSAL